MRLMGTAEKVAKVLRNLPAWPETRRAIARERLGSALPDAGIDRHLHETARWLARAQDASQGAGSPPAGTSASAGCHPSRRPLATSFQACSTMPCLRVRRPIAKEPSAPTDWEIAIQLPDGSVRTGIGLNQTATIFDNGQGLFGFVRAYEETKDERFLAAGLKAGAWLVAMQDSDGCWRRSTFRRCSPLLQHTQRLGAAQVGPSQRRSSLPGRGCG